MAASQEAKKLYIDSADGLFNSVEEAGEYIRKLKRMAESGKGMAALRDADKLLQGYGIEVLESANGRAKAYYVNMGDTYNTTILLVKRPGLERIIVTSWGDWLESQEARGNRFD